MKHLLIPFLFISLAAHSQTNYQRDSMAISSDFQQRIRVATISAAKDILADTSQPIYMINYCQVIISTPIGEQFSSHGSWLAALSYAVASTPGITLNCTDSDIQFTINSNLLKYAKAYFQITTQ